jgi:osmoprotectant transport system substrate-binding protein
MFLTNQLTTGKMPFRLLAGVFFIIALAATGCNASRGSPEKKIVVGAKGFAENQIVARLIQYALDDQGFKTDYINNLDSDVLQTAIETGQIDLYPEYTNTGLTSVLKLAPVFDTQEAYREVKARYKEKFNIVWLAPTSVNDTYCLVLSKKTSNRFGITNITQLQANAGEIRAAQGWDWEDRADLLPAMETKYGKFNFKDKKLYNGSLTYQVLLNDEGDLLIGNTTDPQLENENYVVLEDDKTLWPPYNLVPIVRQEALDKYPEIEGIINGITSSLNTELMIGLNAAVVIRHEEVEDVAREFYNSIKK